MDIDEHGRKAVRYRNLIGNKPVPSVEPSLFSFEGRIGPAPANSLRGHRMKTLLILALIACGCAGAAHAETFTVTRFDDPVPDACLPTDCSLREAADAAATNDPFAGTDIIQLAAGTYTLIRGELSLGAHTQELELVGAGSAQTSIVTDSDLFTEPRDRSLLVRGMSLQMTDGAIGMSARDDSASLVLEDVAIPVGGGGVYASGNDGEEVTLEIRNSALRGIDCSTGIGTCSIVDSQFSSLYAIPSTDPGPTIQITGSLLDGDLDPNQTLTGMVVHRAVLLDIANTTITHADVGVRDFTNPLVVRLDRLTYVNNPGPVRFGVTTDVEITDSTFASNTSRAIYAEGNSTWTISGSSFVSNRVDGNAGGAIVVEDAADMHIENSTFSNNSFTAAAAQGGARGAAIGYRNGSGLNVDLQQVTIVRPLALPQGVEGNAIGGFGTSATVAIDIANSIIAGSCRFDAGALDSAIGNIESAADSCGFNSFINQVGVSAIALAIGALGDHGGPTPTYEPSIDSVAVDSGSLTHCLALDQRGYARPFGSRCDIGAVEVGADDPIFANGFD